MLMAASNSKGSTAVSKLYFWCASPYAMKQLRSKFEELRAALDVKVEEAKKKTGTKKGTRKFARRKLHGTGTSRSMTGSLGSEQLKLGLANKYRSMKK